MTITNNSEGTVGAATPDPAVTSDPDNVGDLHGAVGSDPSTATRAVTEIGELVAVDPRILVVGVNVRRDLALDKPFLRSIAERGVREPIIARRAADGALVVRKGKRRTVAAVEVGRDTVPVLVEPGCPDPTGEDPGELNRAERIERIVDQLEENQHRTGTSDAARSGIASDASFDRTPRTLVREPPWPGEHGWRRGSARRITPGTWRPSSMLG